MEQLSNTISGVIENIEPLIVELAGALGTTVEFVEQNFMFYLIEFGKYQAFIKIPGNLLIAILIASFFGFGIFLLIGIFADDIPEKAEGIILKGIIIFLILLIIFISFWDLICYCITPEIYSITKLIELMG